MQVRTLHGVVSEYDNKNLFAPKMGLESTPEKGYTDLTVRHQSLCGW